MRNLNTKDLFTIAKIIKESDIKESIKNLGFTEQSTNNEIMVKVIFEAITSAPQAEGEIFKFLADIAGVTVDEVKNDEFELLSEIFEHLKGQEKLGAFLKQAFKFAI